MSPAWAAVAMLVRNVLAVFLVQQPGDAGRTAGLVIAAVALANFVGSSAAVRLGRRFIRARRE